MKKWISTAVIYQINLRSLAAREPRNAIEAIREKPNAQSPLAYTAENLRPIKKLGVNTLCLMPPYPIGIEGRKDIGFPYFSRDFTGIEPEYGTFEEFAEFVRRAHKLHLKIIIDFTPNHTARDHVWMTSHPDYYVKTSSDTVFYDCDGSDTAKLNYRNPALREEMIKVYHQWLSFLGKDANGQPDGVDGFRLERAHLINDRRFWDDALPYLKAQHPQRELLFLAECHGMQNNLDLFKRGMNAAYDDDFYKICRYLYAVDGQGQTAVSLSPDAQNDNDFFDKLEAFKTNGIAGALETALVNYESLLAPGEDSPRLARYTDNHDEGRGVWRFGEGAVRAVNQALFLSNHCIPFILNGEEFGAINRPSLHARMSMCDKGRRLLSPHEQRVEAGIEFEGNLFARGFEKRQEWYNFFRELVHLRLKNRELTRGSFLLLNAEEQCERPRRTVIAFERRYRRSVIRCTINLGPESRAVKNSALFEGDLLYGEAKPGHLAPFSAIAVKVKA